MPTLKDVAERAGVTVTTVSRMLNGRVRVSSATQDRIRQAMEELGYYPNEMARSLARKNSSFIGLIVPSAQNYFFADLIQHVEAAAEEQGCRLVLCVSNQDRKKEQAYYQMLMSNKVLGVIMASYELNFEELRHSTRLFIAFEESGSAEIPSASTDDFLGGKLAGTHLLDKGCRHLVYLGANAQKNSVSDRRYAGFCAACAERGIAQPLQMDASWDEFIRMQYDATVGKMFRKYPETDGVFASNDILAAGVVQYCRRNRIDVPGRLKIVGYDDTSFASICSMPLTTIHQPVEELAKYAVRCVVNRANGNTIPSSTVFPVHLVERETT